MLEDPNKGNSPPREAQTNQTSRDDEEIIDLEQYCTLPKAPSCNIGISTQTILEIDDKAYRAELYFNDKCLRVASQNKFNYDTLEVLSNKIIENDTKAIKNICEKNDISISSLKFETKQPVYSLSDNYCGIPLHSHFTLENAIISGKNGKVSINDVDIDIRFKQCDINSEISLHADNASFIECTFRDGIKLNLECQNTLHIKNCTFPKKNSMYVEITGNATQLIFITDKETFPNAGGVIDTRQFYNYKDKFVFYENDDMTLENLENNESLREKPFTIYGNVYDTNIPYSGFARSEQIAIGYDNRRNKFTYGYSLDVKLKKEILTVNSNEKLEFEDRKKLYIALENNDFKTIYELCNKFDLKISCLEFKERQDMGKIRDGYRGIPLDSRFKIINCCFTEESTLYCWHTDILLQNCQDSGLATQACKSIKSMD